MLQLTSKISGASTGSIYHHFANKEMLARALYLEGRSGLNTTLFSSITTNDPHEGIKAIVYAYLNWFGQNADRGQYLMQAGDAAYLSAYMKVVRQKILTALPAESFPEQLLRWLAPYISDGSIIKLPRALIFPILPTQILPRDRYRSNSHLVSLSKKE